MKKYFFLVGILLSASSYGQCVECNSLEEALKQPLLVKSLTINSGMHNLMLENFPTSILKLVNLETLLLTDHHITSIPEAIGDLKHLKVLSFGGCRLSKLPDNIYSLKNLQELILFDNRFSEAYVSKIKSTCKKLLPSVKLMIDLN